MTSHIYDSDFKTISVDKNDRDLYWQKPEFTPPPKPKNKVKVWDWFVEWEDGYVSRINNETEASIAKLTLRTVIHGAITVCQKIDGTERMMER